MADAALMAVAPEVGIPAELAKQLAPHAPMIIMIPLVIIALILIIVGIIALGAAQNKTPGILLTIVGFLLAGGAFFVMVRSESKKKS
jgi:uncharacterized RDD family membrane protein YckC